MKRLGTILLLVASTNLLADTGNISFSGTVSTTCTFSNLVPGTLAVDPSAPSLIGTNVSGGNNATLTITYLGTPTMSVAEVQSFSTKPNGVANGDFNYTTNVSSSQGKAYTASNGNLTAAYASGSSDNLSIIVNATKANGGNVPLGNYATSSVITCQ